MKRSLCIFLFVIIILVSLCSCTHREITSVRSDIAADALMGRVIDALSVSSDSRKDGYVAVGEGYLTESMWGDDLATITEALDEYAVCISSHADTNIDEIGIFRVKDSYDPVEIADIVRDYLHAQSLRYHDLLEAYNPKELPKADSGGDVVICGQYILYTLLDDTATSRAETVFRQTLTAE